MPGLVRSLSVRYNAGSVLASHTHDWGQLVFASEGVMSVSTRFGVWVVPTDRAVWVPGKVEHAIEMTGSVYMRTLYLHPDVCSQLPQDCCVLQVSPLLRELIPHTCDVGMLDENNVQHSHLLGFLLDQLEALPSLPLSLPMPRDGRAIKVARVVQNNPANKFTLTQLCSIVGASRRTIERIFSRETGLTFGQWRQQVRLLEALKLIASGYAINAVALEVGYESPSAFITMFRQAMGVTPKRYFSQAGLKTNKYN